MLTDKAERDKTEMQADHEKQRTEMNQMFDNYKNNMIEDYEKRLKELEALKTEEFNNMEARL